MAVDLEDKSAAFLLQQGRRIVKVIGKRIRYFRKRKNLTQKELGELIGISNRNADVRIAQYESESRIPKRETTNKIARVLEISPYALMVPDLDTPLG